MKKRAKQQRANTARNRSRAPALRAETILLIFNRLRFWLLVLVVLALPLVIYLSNTEYGYTKTIFLLVGVSAALILWSIELVLREKPVLVLTRLAWPALGILGAAVLSLVNAQNILISVQSLIVLVHFGLLSLLIANSVETERDLKILLGGIVLSAGLAGLYGLLQYYGLLLGPPGFKRGSMAMISTMGNPNYLAGFLSHLLVPGIFVFLSVKRAWTRLLLLLALVLITAALVAANSVGAWGAASLSAIFFATGLMIFRLAATVIKVQRRWALALVIVLGFVIWLQSPPGPLNALVGRAATLQALPNPIDQIVQAIQRLWRENSGMARVWNWWIGYEMLRAHPFIGIGLGDYKLEFLEYKAKFKETPHGQEFNFYIPRAVQAHNDYVQIAAELGLIGILAIGFFLGALVVGALGFLRSPASVERRLGVVALGAGIVALMVDALVSFPLHLPASAMNLAIFIGLLHTRPLLSAEPRVALSSKAVRGLGAVAIVLVLVVSVFAYRDWQADIHLDRAQRAIEDRNYKTALEELEQSLALAIAPGRALYYLGLLYAERGQPERALQYLERSLRDAPTENAYIQLAQLYLTLGQVDQVRKHLRTLLRLDPEPLLRLEAEFMHRVLVPWRLGDTAVVWAQLGRFLQEHPNYPRGYLMRGELHRALGQREAAHAQYEKALQLVQAQQKQLSKRLEQIPRYGITDPDEFSRLRARLNGLTEMQAQLERLLIETGSR